MSITTDKLLLVPIGPQHYLALIEGIPQFNESFGIPAADSLRDFIVSGEVSEEWIENLRRAKSADPYVHGFAIVERQDNVVIGMVTCKGPPDDVGMVEIAYGIVPSYQRRGHATKAAQEMLKFAWADPRVRMVRAHTKENNEASIRVLANCGLTLIGKVIDPEDGEVLRWEKPRDQV
jgi:RimJ/RimL family protein N-acetyltransferase